MRLFSKRQKSNSTTVDSRNIGSTATKASASPRSKDSKGFDKRQQPHKEEDLAEGQGYQEDQKFQQQQQQDRRGSTKSISSPQSNNPPSSASSLRTSLTKKSAHQPDSPLLQSSVAKISRRDNPNNDRKQTSSPILKQALTSSSPRQSRTASRPTLASDHRNSRDKNRSSVDYSDTHPLNLPPEEREKRRSALIASEKAYATGGMSESHDGDQQQEQHQHMEEDESPMVGMSSPATSAAQSDEMDSSPMPPPHKSTPDTPPEENDNEELAESYKATGNKFFKAGDYKKAVTEYTRAIEAAPRNPTYLSNRSAAYMGNHNYTEALDDAKKADKLDSGNTKVMLRLARIHTALGECAEALSVYNSMHPPASSKDMSPAVAMSHYIDQAERALQEGNSGSMALYALDLAEKGLGSSINAPRRWQLIRGEAYLKMGNVNALGDAQNVAISLLRINNQDPEALVLRGRALYAQGENEKALQHFRQALSCDPDYREAVKYLRLVQRLDKMKEDGNIAFKAGRYDEAVKLYSGALEVDPLNKCINSKILQNRALASIKV